jgi:hypothetical protein
MGERISKETSPLKICESSDSWPTARIPIATRQSTTDRKSDLPARYRRTGVSWPLLAAFPTTHGTVVILFGTVPRISKVESNRDDSSDAIDTNKEFQYEFLVGIR